MIYPRKKTSYREAIQQARSALKSGNRRLARRWAERAAALAPDKEEPWLIMAALASPRASLEYLKRVLEINPQSTSARKGMHWAIQRYRSATKDSLSRYSNHTKQIPNSVPQRRVTLYSWVIILLVIVTGAAAWFGTPSFSFASYQVPNVLVLAQEWAGKATLTPSVTATHTLAPTFTPSPTPSNTPTSSSTVTPTNTASPLPTETAIPPTIAPRQDDEPQVSLPPGVEKGEIWIDVDLTNQQLHVYKGKNLLTSYLVSTGTWHTPTVTGQYRIYVKYPAADMAGPGYYLPRVPYVMYFYEGYGLHGTYWHNNFGTPMSHGCVNLRTEDAESVYNKVVVGTIVNIHY